MLAYQRMDFAVALRFHVFRFNRAVFRQQIRQGSRETNDIRMPATQPLTCIEAA